jgi:hypothetical protein
MDLTPGGTLAVTDTVAWAAATTGTYTFTVQVTDSIGGTATIDYSLSVSNLEFTTTTLPDGFKDTVYTATTITVTGGQTPYTFSISTGTLPTGMTLDSITGVISGTPANAGTFDFTVQVEDSTPAPDQQIATQAFSLFIDSSLQIDETQLPPNGAVNVPYSFFMNPLGGTPPYTWSMASGPHGLSIDSLSGELTGTPTAAGTYYPVFTLTDSDGLIDTLTATITINPEPSDDGGGSGTTGGNTACYIATAAYGSYLDPHVDALRGFRDSVLMKSAIGRELVQFYYRTSPPVAAFIARHDTARAAMRVVLTPIVYSVKYPLLGFAMVFGSGALGAAWWRRRRRAREEA